MGGITISSDMSSRVGVTSYTANQWTIFDVENAWDFRSFSSNISQLSLLHQYPLTICLLSAVLFYLQLHEYCTECQSFSVEAGARRSSEGLSNRTGSWTCKLALPVCSIPVDQSIIFHAPTSHPPSPRSTPDKAQQSSVLDSSIPNRAVPHDTCPPSCVSHKEGT